MKKNKLTKRELLLNRLRCPVCNKHYFNELNAYEICPVCGWEDDPSQRRDPYLSGGANIKSLIDYRKEYEKKN